MDAQTIFFIFIGFALGAIVAAIFIELIRSKEKKPSENKIIQSLNILNESDKTVDEFRKEMGLLGDDHDSAYKQLMITLRESQLARVIRNDKDVKLYMIQPKGISLLINKNIQSFQKEQNKIQKDQLTFTYFQLVLTAALILTTLFLGIFSFTLSATQTEIANRQVEILEESTPPYEPKLKIWSISQPLELSTQKLSNEIGQKEEIRICIKNIGQTSSGHIYAHWDNEWSFNNNGLNINPGIEAGQTNCTYLELAAKNCFGDIEDCDPSIIPEGDIDLSLYVKCDYCEEREQNKELKACIWKKSGAECENET